MDVLSKTLWFNGNENWNAFKQKSMRNAQLKNCAADESKDYEAGVWMEKPAKPSETSYKEMMTLSLITFFRKLIEDLA